MSELTNSILAVLNPGGNIVGTAFFIAPKLAVTCAHVIDSAKSGPGKKVTVEFRLHDLKPVPMSAQVAEQGWSPRKPALPDQKGEDVAFLELVEMPDGAQVLPLTSARGKPGRDISSYGFPKSSFYGADTPLGKIGEPVPLLYRRASDMLLLDEMMQSKFRRGMSGGPLRLVGSEVVVGMVTEENDKDGVHRVYAVTADTIVGLWPGLKLEQESETTADEDIELMEFYRSCLKRPAFENLIHYGRDLKKEGFDDAIKHTITAINTGVSLDREIKIGLRKYTGKLYFNNVHWQKQMDLISKRLKEIHAVYAENIGSVDDYSDKGVVRTMDNARVEVMNLFNEICVEAGIPPLEYAPALDDSTGIP